MKEVLLKFLKALISPKGIMGIAAGVAIYVAGGFTDPSRSLGCLITPDKCIAEAILLINQTPASDIAAASVASDKDTKLMQVKTIEGETTVTVPTADAVK